MTGQRQMSAYNLQPHMPRLPARRITAAFAVSLPPASRSLKPHAGELRCTDGLATVRHYHSAVVMGVKRRINFMLSGSRCARRCTLSACHLGRRLCWRLCGRLCWSFCGRLGRGLPNRQLCGLLGRGLQRTARGCQLCLRCSRALPLQHHQSFGGSSCRSGKRAHLWRGCRCDLLCHASLAVGIPARQHACRLVLHGAFDCFNVQHRLCLAFASSESCCGQPHECARAWQHALRVMTGQNEVSGVCTWVKASMQASGAAQTHRQ